MPIRGVDGVLRDRQGNIYCRVCAIDVGPICDSCARIVHLNKIESWCMLAFVACVVGTVISFLT